VKKFPVPLILRPFSYTESTIAAAAKYVSKYVTYTKLGRERERFLTPTLS
jgi:hypothetical protein